MRRQESLVVTHSTTYKTHACTVTEDIIIAPSSKVYAAADDKDLESSSVQTASTKLNADSRPASDTSSLRRRQSFTFVDAKQTSPAPKAGLRARQGQPSGLPIQRKAAAVATVRAEAPTAATTAAVPPAAVTASKTAKIAVSTFSVAAAKPSIVDRQVASGRASPQPSTRAVSGAVSAQPSTKAAAQRKPGSSSSPSRPSAHSSPSSSSSPERAPAKSPAAAAASGSSPIQKQGSSMSQLVKTYKADAAARKQAQMQDTLQRVNSLASTALHSTLQNQASTSRAALGSGLKSQPAAKAKDVSRQSSTAEQQNTAAERVGSPSRSAAAAAAARLSSPSSAATAKAAATQSQSSLTSGSGQNATRPANTQPGSVQTVRPAQTSRSVAFQPAKQKNADGGGGSRQGCDSDQA